MSQPTMRVAAQSLGRDWQGIEVSDTAYRG